MVIFKFWTIIYWYMFGDTVVVISVLIYVKFVLYVSIIAVCSFKKDIWSKSRRMMRGLAVLVLRPQTIHHIKAWSGYAISWSIIAGYLHPSWQAAILYPQAFNTNDQMAWHFVDLARHKSIPLHMYMWSLIECGNQLYDIYIFINIVYDIPNIYTLKKWCMLCLLFVISSWDTFCHVMFLFHPPPPPPLPVLFIQTLV